LKEKPGCLVSADGGGLNPKVFLLFLALLPQFAAAAAWPVPMQMVVLGWSHGQLWRHLSGGGLWLPGSFARAARRCTVGQKYFRRGDDGYRGDLAHRADGEHLASA
jgi:hypothetical protein